MPDTLSEDDWSLLLRRIKLKKCTPFIGAGACHNVLPSGKEIAQEWSSKYEYPLEDGNDLVRVAQYVAVNQDAMSPKEDLLLKFAEQEPPAPDFTRLDEPHNLLASLDLPLYITTNYDSFMMQALQRYDKIPVREVCRWNKATDQLLKDEKSSLDRRSKYVYDGNNPIVYHLHGYDRFAESLVLTEDDYLDFLINMSKNPGLLPARIQSALTTTSLLFIGYRIADWDFRVLFHNLVYYLERSTNRAHVSVQLTPVGKQASREQQKKAQTYLDKYFGKLQIKVYWGTCTEFVTDFRRRWGADKNGRSN